MRPHVFERSAIAVAHVHIDDGSYCRMIHVLSLLRAAVGSMAHHQPNLSFPR
jgi:hypothetical protein